MSIPIVPAIIPDYEIDVIASARKLRFSHELHLDVVDGNFVFHTSWPFTMYGTRKPLSVKTHTDAFTLEVDLMTTKPIPAAREWIEAGADMLVFHIETVDLASFKDFVEFAPKEVSVGVSFHGDTPTEAVFPYLEYADYVQVMGIHTIGVQGQPFDEEVFTKIETIRSKSPDMLISVDGAVNRETAPRLMKAGVNRLIVGSAIVFQPDWEAAYNELNQTVNGAM